MQIISIWLILRIITSFIAAVASSLKPFTEIESRIAIWPISSPVSEWFNRVFISPWYRWDVEWYVKIIEDGYQSGDGTTNFHPLYPWLGKILTYLNFNTTFSLLIISSTATLLLLFMMRKLASLDFNKKQTHFSIWIYLLFPIAFILFAPYPESLFLLFSVSCFYWLRKKNWLVAGFSAFLAVLTRPQGVFLIFPFIWELWEASEKNISLAISNWRKWLTLGLIPLAYLSWIGYRFFVLNDGNLNSTDFQSAIYSIFLSSSANQVVPDQYFLWPWKSIYLAIEKIISSPDVDIWTNSILTIIFLTFLIFGWKNMRISYKIYTFVILIISLSYHTGSIHPYMGLPRHLFLAFPIFINISPKITRNNNIFFSYTLGGIILMSILVVEYTLTAWVP